MVNRFKEGIVVTLVLIGALLFFYRDVVFGGHTFLVEASTYGTMPKSPTGLPGPYGYSGPIDKYKLDPMAESSGSEPDSRFIALSYQSGQIPLWNPHEGLGIPFYARGQVGVFDPIRLMTTVFMPIKWWPLAVDLQLLFRYFLGGLFTYLFLRSLGATLFPALAAGVAFMFCTYFLMYGNIAHAPVELLFPLTLLAYHQLAVKRSLGSLILCASSIFLLVVTDFPELYPLHIGFGLVWFCFQAILVVRKTPDKWRLSLVMALRFLAATLLGLMLGAFVLLPFVQLLLNALNVHNSSDIVHYALRTVLHQALVIGSGEFGRLNLAPLLLIAIGLLFGFGVQLDERLKQLFVHQLALLGIAAVSFLVAYNVPGFSLVAKLPVLNMIILSKYIQPILAFLLACAGGIGLELFLSINPRPRIERLVFLGGFGLLLVLLVAALVRAGRPVAQVPVQSLVFDSAVLLVFLLGAALKKRTRLSVVGMFFVALVVLEPAVVNSYLQQRPARYDPFTVPPFISYLQQQNKPFRIAAEDNILFPQQSTAYELDDARYQDALDPLWYVEYCKRFMVDTNVSTDSRMCINIPLALVYNRGLDLLNVEYVVTATPNPPARTDSGKPLELAYASDGVYVFHNPNVLPRAFIVRDAEVVPTLNGVFDRLASKDFDPAQTVLLEEAPPQGFTNTSAVVNAASQSAQVVLHSDNDMTVQTTLSASGFLVVSELYYPGWEAVVDGQPAHLYVADGIFRAVALGPGEHKVEFHFRPTVFYVGLLLALVSLLIMIAALVVQKGRRQAAGPTG